MTALACIQLENGLRPDQVALGLPAGPGAAGGGVVAPRVVNQALDCLARGTNCGSFRPPRTYPGIRGAMTWSINWDVSNGNGSPAPSARTSTPCSPDPPSSEDTMRRLASRPPAWPPRCSVAGVALAPSASAATAAFVRTSSWGSGYEAKFTVTNNTSTTITSWNVAFDLPGRQRASARFWDALT